MKLLDYVNTKQGTKNQVRLSNGNTLPLTALPHGMASFTMQTCEKNTPWFYHPDDVGFEGIRLTHQPSPWVGDYGQLIMMPKSGELKISAEDRYSAFDRKKTVIHPHYLEGYLLCDEIFYQLAPTECGAVINLTYQKGEENRLSLHLPQAMGMVHCEKNRISGYTEASTHNNGFPLREYFILEFDCEIESVMVFNTAYEQFHRHFICCEGAGISVTFINNKVTCKLATSYISLSQAEINFNAELKDFSYEQIKEKASLRWEKMLGIIKVSDEDEERKKTFYSCFARALLYPRKFYEKDINGNPWHLNLKDGSVKEGVLYVDNGFWDTYRTLYPLYSLILPKLYREILEGYYNFACDTGYLPKWLSPVELGFMPGSLIEAVIADGIAKKILDKEYAIKILPFIERQALCDAPDRKQGRLGSEAYQKFGYLPREIYNESINHTLDSTYGDYCIAVVENELGREQERDFFLNRSKSYANLFKKDVGFMCGKDSKGNWKENFNPFDWGGDFCEGGAWQNSFAVPHDMQGLANLYGGEEKLLLKVNELFSSPKRHNIGGYCRVIHEMNEMSFADFGQCAISNEPSFHIPYIYSEFGDTEKTAKIVERMTDLFSYHEDGFPGDEDNGALSCWYIFACLGFYPFCPGRGDYVLSKPLFNHIEMTLPSEKKLIIEKQQKPLQISKISHDTIKQGGNLFELAQKLSDLIKI